MVTSGDGNCLLHAASLGSDCCSLLHETASEPLKCSPSLTNILPIIAHRVSKTWWHFYILNNSVKNGLLWYLECRILMTFYMNNFKLVHLTWKMPLHCFVKCIPLSSDRSTTCNKYDKQQEAPLLPRTARCCMSVESMWNVWRLREKIIRTAACCDVYSSFVQWYMRTCEQFLKLCVVTFRFCSLCVCACVVI